MNGAQREQSTPFYEFGPFRVDSVKYVLTRDGEVVPLNLKAFEILLALIQNRGQVLEKNELLQRVWPDTVVEENNLARNISALRKALDEQPNAHHYILTVPGRGYRFVASVREVDGASEEFMALQTNGFGSKADADAALYPLNGAEIAPGPAINEASEALEALNGKILPRNRWTIIAFATLATLTIAILAIFPISRRSQDDSPPPQPKLWQLTFDAGLESEPSWSPDGRMIAYSSDRSGNFDIWVQPVGEGDPVRVTTSEAHDWQPDWAPEGNRLVFRSERDGGGLFVTPVLGGKERKVSSFGSSPRWSPDGAQILFYSSPLQTTEIPKIYLVGLDGKPPREVMADFLPQFGFFRLAWRPDGKHLSLWGWSRQDKWTFWTVPLDGGPPAKSEIDPKVEERMREASVILTDFLWSPSGQTLYFEGTSQSVRNLWKVEVDPRSLRWTAGPERLTTAAGPDTDIAISPDGRKLAFTARAEKTRLWSLPFDASAGRIKGESRPVTSAEVKAGYPELSPDGRKVAFVTRRAGKWEFWEKSLKDGSETLLAADELHRAQPHWSHDGSRLIYNRSRQLNQEGSRHENSLALMPSGGGAEQTLTTPSMANISVWDWSFDGKWILGGADHQPGRHAICIFPIAAAPQAEKQMRMVTSHPDMNLYQARFSPDQKWISFIAAKAIEAGISTIFVVPASGGEWRRVTEAKYFDDKPRWSPDGRRLYFVSNRTGFFNVWGIDFDPASGQPRGEPFRVTNFESPAQMVLPEVGVMEMALAADRIVLPIMEVSGGIWILENVGR
ncbi:MAG TPA: winged helix-turn-helix domain-containing protein [Blastocatellia bacterium]|nr:winged helix-turn-helix domain-containing protein [Blastocatellia bacterium]